MDSGDEAARFFTVHRPPSTVHHSSLELAGSSCDNQQHLGGDVPERGKRHKETSPLANQEENAMNANRLGSLLGLLLLAAVAAPGLERVEACAPAPPANKPVAIASESALIIWDEASKTQHFIRRASFTTEAKDFGFLVPTPTQPTLEAASDEAFAELARITAPKTVEKKRPSGGGCGIGCAAGNHRTGDAVRVLEEKRVAGYDAKVLEADDADALETWLKQHDYEVSRTLKDWVKPYLADRWIISAFKIAKDDAGADAVATSAVRMTFRTEQPFFPYREPAEADEKKPASQRLLRVFFLSTGPVKGTLGQQGEAWPGKVAWSGRIEAADRKRLLELLKLPLDSQPGDWWLTEFEDPSSPRPGTVDVYFAASEAKDPVERPPHIRYISGVWQDAVPYAALAVCMLTPLTVRVWRRRRRNDA
jgi:hypothetical protein